MPNPDSAIEISPQPKPIVPDIASEKAALPNLGADLEMPWQRELEKKRQETEQQRKDHALEVERVMLKQRRRYAFALFGLSAIWLLFIGSYLILAGRGVLKTADSVLIALISTTTANVLG